MSEFSFRPVICATIMWALPVACWAQSHTMPAWKVTQHSRLCGSETIYLSPAAIRVENHVSSLVTVARAPDWKICKYNPRGKVYWEVAYAQFHNKFASGQVLTGSVILDKATVTKTGISTFNSQTVDKYTSSKAFEAEAFAMRHHQHSVTGSFPASFEMIALPAGFIPEPEAHIISVLHSSPDAGVCVLEIICHAFDSTKYNFISTQDIKKVSVEAQYFMPPPGYKQVSSETELVFDSKHDQDLLNLMR